ncbi:MAG: hypothetical protein A2Z32_04865 [Chloroflexi bacterium RBG_16_69_14]|nr:MAG: hypothetical protein A2Z32_04865 [Chloroflexi bacterium RBG_16_69_14]
MLAEDGQSRADVEAAIVPHGGKLTSSVLLEKAGIYVARFPVDNPRGLEEIRQALESAGFRAAMSYAMELFA